jgi:hypothetical protein
LYRNALGKGQLIAASLHPVFPILVLPSTQPFAVFPISDKAAMLDELKLKELRARHGLFIALVIITPQFPLSYFVRWQFFCGLPRGLAFRFCLAGAKNLLPLRILPRT